MDRAIGHFRAALAMEDAALSLKALEQLVNLEIRHGAKLLAAKKDGKHEAGDAYLKQGLARLNLLIEIGPTAERLSLLGSYWKHRARAHHARGNLAGLKPDLVEMQAAYWRAAEHAHARNGDWDPYPLFNALDADFLMAARGERANFDRHAVQLSNLLQAGAETARRRFAENRNFFHALTAVEAMRIDALWAGYDGRDDDAITQPEVLARLLAGYRDVLKRLGGAGEQDSAINQPRFLMDMLIAGDKSNKIKEALNKLVEGIRQCVA